MGARRRAGRQVGNQGRARALSREATSNEVNFFALQAEIFTLKLLAAAAGVARAASSPREVAAVEAAGLNPGLAGEMAALAGASVVALRPSHVALLSGAVRPRVAGGVSVTRRSRPAALSAARSRSATFGVARGASVKRRFCAATRTRVAVAGAVVVGAAVPAVAVPGAAAPCFRAAGAAVPGAGGAGVSARGVVGALRWSLSPIGVEELQER